MTRRALLIGSPVYGLMAVASDVDAMEQRLRRRGFDCRRCFGEEATRHGILAACESLIDETAASDAVVIYLAGHGGLASSYDDPPPGRPVLRYQFFVPWDIDETTAHDFRGVTSLELSSLLARLTSRTKNVTAILDCCHAAGMARSFGRGTGYGQLNPRSLPRVWVEGVRHHLDALREQGLSADHLDATGNPHAVRLVATSATQLAYEHTDEHGHARGLLTWALCTALDEAGGRPVSWRGMIDRIRRLVQSQAYSQRPEVEGPSGRVLFEEAELPSIGVPLTVNGGEVFLGEGRIQGVEAGDVYCVLSPTTAGGEPRPVGECTVRRVEVARSLVDVRFADAPTGFQQGALPYALPMRRTGRTWPVEVGGHTHLRDRLCDAIRAAPLLRVHEPGDADAALAVVSEVDGGLVVRDPLGRDLALAKPSGDAAPVAETVGQLMRLARARAVATLTGGEGDYALGLPFAMEWGKVVGGQRVPPPGRDTPLQVGDRLYVAVRNLSGQPLFVHFFDVGVSASVTVLNRSHPSGVELQPGDEYVLGTAVDGRLVGLQTFWPVGVSQDGPRDESVVALVMDRPLVLDSIEQAGLRTERGLSGRDRFWATLLSGRGTRDLADPGAEPEVRYAVSLITFSLSQRT
jgi:hypothetical protein